MTDQIVATLQQGLRGRVIGRHDADYDAARALYNGMIDKRPVLIARCVDVADVITAVNFGREQNLLIAIRGGGHNGPGLGSVDDGLVIDLSLMKSVHVNPSARIEKGTNPNRALDCIVCHQCQPACPQYSAEHNPPRTPVQVQN